MLFILKFIPFWVNVIIAIVIPHISYTVVIGIIHTYLLINNGLRRKI